MPDKFDKVTDKLQDAKIITEQVKVLTPDAVDRIIDQNVNGPIEIAGEGISLWKKIQAMFKKKKKGTQ